MPNRYPDRKRIVRDDEDGPIASPVMNNRLHHDNSVQSQQQLLQNQRLMGSGSTANGLQLAHGPMSGRVYPPQKPFYFGMPSPKHAIET